MVKSNINKEGKNDRNNGEASSKYLKYFIGIIPVIVIVVVLAIVFSGNSKNYVAEVGNEKISVMEFNAYLKQVKNGMLYEAQINPGTPEAENFWKTANFNGLSAADEAKRQALDEIRRRKIQVIKAKEKKIKIEEQDKKEIDNQINAIIQQYGNSKAKTNEALMESIGMDLNGLRKMYIEGALAAKFYSSETSAINVSDDDIKSAYDSDTKSYDKLTVRHILISKQDLKTSQWFSEEKKNEAEKKAKDILAKVNSGEDMKKLAEEYSEDPPAKENGGEYSFTIFDRFVEEFKDWAVKANVGDTGIVETDYGYHVMKLEKREPVSFEDSKGNIKNKILQDKYTELLEQWEKDPAFVVKKNDKVYNTLQ